MGWDDLRMLGVEKYIIVCRVAPNTAFSETAFLSR